jgi:hypothetical protein
MKLFLQTDLKIDRFNQLPMLINLKLYTETSNHYCNWKVLSNYNLIVTAKIIMAAHYNSRKIHPLEYAYNCL